MAGGQINCAMLRDRFAERLSIVRNSVTTRAKRADVEPCIHRRQIQNVGPYRFGEGVECCGLVYILNRGGGSNVLKMKPVGKGFDPVGLSGADNLFSALSIRRKHGHFMADNVLHVNLGPRVVLITDDHGGPGNVLHAAVFHPKLLGVVRVDGNRRGNVLELRANQSQPGFVFTDRSLALTFEVGINHGELPSWRRFPGPDSVLAAKEMHVLRDVAAVVNTSQARTYVKVNVRQKAMLGIVGAHANGARISVLNLKINVTERRVERARARILWDIVVTGRRALVKFAFVPRTTTGKENHVSGPLLKACGVWTQHKCGPSTAVTNHSDARPNIDCFRETVMSGRNKNDALALCFLNSVNRLLYGVGVIRDTVPTKRELLPRQINGFGIVRARWIVRGCTKRKNRRHKDTCCGNRLQHFKSSSLWSFVTSSRER